MTSHLSHYFQIKVFFLWKRFSWFAEYSGSSMHLLIDLKSPEYLNLPQHFTVSRTLQRATVFHNIKTRHSKKRKICPCVHHSSVFSLGNRWRWVVSFTIHPFAFKENVYVTTGIGEFWDSTVRWSCMKYKKVLASSANRPAILWSSNPQLSFKVRN